MAKPGRPKKQAVAKIAKVATVVIVPVEEVGWLRQLGQNIAAFYSAPTTPPAEVSEVHVAITKPKRRKPNAKRGATRSGKP